MRRLPRCSVRNPPGAARSSTAPPSPGRRPRAMPKFPDSGASFGYRFLPSMYRRIFVRALAICERTVALEQSRCAPLPPRASPPHRATQCLPLARTHRRIPSSRYSRCSPRSNSCSGLSVWLSGASSSRRTWRGIRRRKSIAVFVAILDNQCAAFCSSFSCSWCCSA